jgi:tRNA(Ile)-lysidine synthase
VLPFLEQRLNPRLRDALRRTAGILRADNDWLEALARDVLRQTSVGRGALDIKKLSVFPLAARRRALRLWLVAGGLPPDAIDFDLINRIEILLGQEQGSQSLNLPRDRRVRRSYALLTLEKTPTARRTRATTAVAVRVPGVTVWPTAGLRVLVAVRPGLIRERPREPGHVPSSASLGRVVTGGLALRFCRPGDRLRPLGLHGSKKIQDILVDAKVPRDRRATIPVLAYRGAIVWLPGYRIAEGWQVRDASRPALHIRLRPAGRAPTVPAR